MERHDRGKSIIALPDDFVVIDTETTGLDFDCCDLIEVSAIRYRNNTPVGQFSSLVKPPMETPFRGENGEVVTRYVDQFITDLTGITNEMLESAPSKEEVIPAFLDFIEDSILVGHNTAFDINFLYDAAVETTGVTLKNNYINTIRLAHKEFPGMEHYRLSDVAAACEVDQKNAHRGLADCETTAQCYLKMKERILSRMTEADFKRLFAKKVLSYKDFIGKIDSSDFTPDSDNPIFGKTVVFTGTLEKMVRKDALLLVAKLGGIPSNTITKSTNFLVIGNGEFAASVKEGHSKKMKKAEKYQLSGFDIQIISENAFFELIYE